MPAFATPRIEMDLPPNPLTLGGGLAPSLWVRQESLSPLVADEAVGQWDDESGNDRHLVQATEASKPVVKLANINGTGRGAVYFDGTDDSLSFATFASLLGSDFTGTIFTVFSTSYDSADESTVWANNGSPLLPSFRHSAREPGTLHLARGRAFAHGPFNGFRMNGSRPPAHGGPMGQGDVATEDTAILDWHVGTWVYDGNTVGIGVDHAGEDLSFRPCGSPIFQQDGAFCLGTNGAGYYGGSPTYFKGYVAEIVVFPQALSATDRLRVAKYLGLKYNTASPSDFAEEWVTVSDVLGGPGIQAQYGIRGTGPLDRVASKGSLQFQADNSEICSGGFIGYYLPGHPCCRAGFGFGTQVRLVLNYDGVDYYKWRGVVDSVQPADSKGKRRVAVSCVDWMDEAARTKLRAIPVQTNLRSDQLFEILLANVVKQPAATQVGFGMEGYPYALDNVQDEKTVLLTELQKLANSELGYIYVKGDTHQGGTLVFEDRRARGANTTVAADFPETRLVTLPTRRGRNDIINRVLVKVHPRRVDTSAGTFSPLDLVSLTLWLDASQLTGLVDGDLVDTFTDMSGLGNDLTATSTVRPTYKTGIVNGNPVLRFDGSNDRMTGPNLGNFISTSEGTVFVVAKQRVTSGSSQWVLCAGTAAQRNFEVQVASTLYRFRHCDGTDDNVDKTPITPDQWNVVMWGHDTGQLCGSVNDARDAGRVQVASGNTAGTSDPLCLGAYVDAGVYSNWFDGDIAEVLAFNTALSEADRKNVESYLATKYDLTSLLPYDPTGLGSVGSVIFDLDDKPAVPRGVTITLNCPYKDPAQSKARIGAVQQVTPVAGTDYLANTNVDGSGTNITSQFSVKANFGGNTATLRITNNGPLDGYITQMQIRGNGVYDEGEVTVEAEDEASQAAYGENLVTLNMTYQADPLVANDAAHYLLQMSRADAMSPNVMRFCANRDASTLLDFLTLEISSRITVSEALTGIRGTYYINHIAVEVRESLLFVTYMLAPADTETYWVLNLTGQTELDVSTKLAYGLWNRFWILGVAALSSDTRVNP